MASLAACVGGKKVANETSKSFFFSCPISGLAFRLNYAC